MFPIGGEDGAGGLATWVLFLLLAAPSIMLLRMLGRLARVRYGFGDPPVDDGPPIRVCGECHNTVLETDYTHCPYCGSQLTESSAGVDA